MPLLRKARIDSGKVCEATGICLIGLELASRLPGCLPAWLLRHFKISAAVIAAAHWMMRDLKALLNSYQGAVEAKRRGKFNESKQGKQIRH